MGRPAAVALRPGMAPLIPAAKDTAVWRRQERARLLAARAALGTAERAEAEGAIRRRLAQLLTTTPGRVVGLYWAVHGEPDTLPLGADLLARDRLLALP